MKSPCKTCSAILCNCIQPKTSGEDKHCDYGKSPVSHIHSGATPSKRSQQRFSNFICNTPLDRIKASHGVKAVTLASTPTRTGSTAVCNPFELEVDSLLVDSCSPSMFSSVQHNSNETSPFWKIEHLSLIQPVDIDESSLQESYLRLDAEKEVKAQEAINTFFSRNVIAPSPWTPAVKYTSFAPHLASTACYSQIENEQISYVSCDVSADDLPSREVSTQTMLTIPPFLDLMTLLGHFYTYQPSIPKEYLDSSFRRRKLFMNDEHEDEQEDETSMCLPISQELNNNVPPKTPETKVHPWKNQTQHFSSSSPIARRTFSFFGNDMKLPSPDLSPVGMRTSQRTPEPEPNTPVNMLYEDNSNSSIVMTSISEAHPTEKSSKEQDIKHMTKDTGYTTGSIDCTSLLMMSDPPSRTTPVAELLEDCALTGKKQILDSQIACEDFSMSQSDNSIKFSILPWQTEKFSTPTKM